MFPEKSVETFSDQQIKENPIDTEKEIPIDTDEKEIALAGHFVLPPNVTPLVEKLNGVLHVYTLFSAKLAEIMRLLLIHAQKQSCACQRKCASRNWAHILHVRYAHLQ